MAVWPPPTTAGERALLGPPGAGLAGRGNSFLYVPLLLDGAGVLGASDRAAWEAALPHWWAASRARIAASGDLELDSLMSVLPDAVAAPHVAAWASVVHNGRVAARDAVRGAIAPSRGRPYIERSVQEALSGAQLSAWRYSRNER